MPNNSAGSHLKDGPQKAIKRFPRRLEGEEAAAIEKLAWGTPEFRACMAADEYAVDFIFRISLSQLPKRYRALFGTLFFFGSDTWESAFSWAYSRLKYGDKDLERSVANRLHKLFLTGIQVWLDESWSREGNPQNEKNRTTELEAFKKQATIKRNQPDPIVALWTASRRDELFPVLESLRNRVGTKARVTKPKDLQDQIAAFIPYQTFLEALRRLSENPQFDPRRFFYTSLYPVTSVVEAMLTAELELKGYDLKRISLKKYLKEGEQLLTSLSLLPKLQS